MNRAPDDVAIHRDLPAVLEAFRAISGLSAIVVLVALTAGLILRGEPQAGLHAVAAYSAGPVSSANAEDEQGTPSSARGFLVPWSPPKTSVHVFYLVATPEQESTADWGEQVGQMEVFNLGQHTPDRHYSIHYAQTEAEESAASRAILQVISELQAGALVEVIDLRDTPAGQ